MKHWDNAAKYFPHFTAPLAHTGNTVDSRLISVSEQPWIWKLTTALHKRYVIQTLGLKSKMVSTMKAMLSAEPRLGSPLGRPRAGWEGSPAGQ